MSDEPKIIPVPDCEPPRLTDIGKHRRNITWTNPRGKVINVKITGGPNPDHFFVNGRRVGPNYQMTFTGGAPDGSVWTYSLWCHEGGIESLQAQQPGATEPELTNGF